MIQLDELAEKLSSPPPNEPIPPLITWAHQLWRTSTTRQHDYYGRGPKVWQVQSEIETRENEPKNRKEKETKSHTPPRHPGYEQWCDTTYDLVGTLFTSPTHTLSSKNRQYPPPHIFYSTLEVQVAIGGRTFLCTLGPKRSIGTNEPNPSPLSFFISISNPTNEHHPHTRFLEPHFVPLVHAWSSNRAFDLVRVIPHPNT
jgi:hypothetical protein